MPKRATSRKTAAGSRRRSASRDLSRFAPLATEGLRALAKSAERANAHFRPIEALHAHYATQYEPDARLVEYARLHGARCLDASRALGAMVATSRSYGAVRLVAQSWRASDAGDFRTDAIRDMVQWDHTASTPSRYHAMEESGIANPGNEGWIDLPADRSRVYALWVILRGYSRSTYAPPSITSAIVTAKCVVPFIFVEH